VLRCDRGLSASEQDEFSAWLAADPRHGRELARHRRHWQRLDRLGQWRPEHSDQPNPDLLAVPLRRRLYGRRPISLTLAAAAALALGVVGLWQLGEIPSSPPPPGIAGDKTPATKGPLVLDDGTKVELNEGTDVRAQFSATERRVQLTRGEAHFTVTKDPARPFIVSAGGVDVRAVGTAFNVRADAAVIEVLVTEGTVQVSSGNEPKRQPASSGRGPETVADPRARDSDSPVGGIPSRGTATLTARQRAVVSLSAPQEPPLVATLTLGEIDRVLAWQHRLLDFNAAPLSSIVAEFNRRNPTQLVVLDPVLAAVPISATFRSDNIAGFVHLLEAGFGVRAERRSDAEIVLHPSR
jgi:transmembrane sensor